MTTHRRQAPRGAMSDADLAAWAKSEGAAITELAAAARKKRGEQAIAGPSPSFEKHALAYWREHVAQPNQGTAPAAAEFVKVDTVGRDFVVGSFAEKVAGAWAERHAQLQQNLGVTTP